MRNTATELKFENMSITRTRDVCTYVQETSTPYCISSIFQSMSQNVSRVWMSLGRDRGVCTYISETSTPYCIASIVQSMSQNVSHVWMSLGCDSDVQPMMYSLKMYSPLHFEHRMCHMYEWVQGAIAIDSPHKNSDVWMTIAFRASVDLTFQSQSNWSVWNGMRNEN